MVTMDIQQPMPSLEEASSLILNLEQACSGNVHSQVTKTHGSGKLEFSTDVIAVEIDFQAQRLASEAKNVVPLLEPPRTANGMRSNVPSQSEVTRSFLNRQEKSTFLSAASKSTQQHAVEADAEE